jgi:hypothetical protein
MDTSEARPFRIRWMNTIFSDISSVIDCATSCRSDTAQAVANAHQAW